MLPFSEIAEPFIFSEGEGWRLVFKPSGMDSVPLRDMEEGTLAGWLRAQPGNQKISDVVGDLRFTSEMGMLSRLDRDTSGLILCATDKKSFEELFRFQGQGLLRKRYRLLCSPTEKEMDGSRPARFGYAYAGLNPAPLVGESISSRFRAYGKGASRVACVAEALSEDFRGKLSKETYSTLIVASASAGSLADNWPGYSLDVEISKGFRHQIRAHLAWTGFPIVGDSLYGGKLAMRLFLESYGITFPAPKEGHGVVEARLYGDEVRL